MSLNDEERKTLVDLYWKKSESTIKEFNCILTDNYLYITNLPLYTRKHNVYDA